VDYPNSVPSAGLVDGKFVDESPIMGASGIFDASCGSGVTLELFKVFEAAGIKPSEASNDQQLPALRSNKLFGDRATDRDKLRFVLLRRLWKFSEHRSSAPLWLAGYL
jgi:hypothetical protein